MVAWKCNLNLSFQTVITALQYPPFGFLRCTETSTSALKSWSFSYILCKLFQGVLLAWFFHQLDFEGKLAHDVINLLYYEHWTDDVINVINLLYHEHWTVQMPHLKMKIYVISTGNIYILQNFFNNFEKPSPYNEWYRSEGR